MAKKKAKKSKVKARKPAKRKAVKKAKPKAKAAVKKKPAAIILKAPEKQLVGKVVHFYNHLSVAVVDVTDHELKVGDTISIEGLHTKLKQKVTSMQVEHEQVQRAAVGQSVGMKVNGRVHEKDAVYKVL